MGADDAVADAQTQPSAFGGLFGGVKGVENAFGSGTPVPLSMMATSMFSSMRPV